MKIPIERIPALARACQVDAAYFLRLALAEFYPATYAVIVDTIGEPLTENERDRGTAAIMAATAKSKTCVWRWQERFMHEGVDGLLREKTRPPGIARTPDGKVADVIRLTQAPPPHEATHWTIRAMGKAVGLAASTVRSIWKAHGLSPHRWRQFKLSNDPAFAQKLQDVVDLYVAPPAHAVVLSIDEKSQIQALDRTQPGLPLKKGRRPTMTHDYKRNSLPRT